MTGSYSGWKPNREPPILKSAQDVHTAMFGKAVAVKAVHAFLECGINGEK